MWCSIKLLDQDWEIPKSYHPPNDFGIAAVSQVNLPDPVVAVGKNRWEFNPFLLAAWLLY